MNTEVGQAGMGPHLVQCSCTGSAAAVVLHPLFVFAVQEGRERCVCVCVWYKPLGIAGSFCQSSDVGKGSQASCSSWSLGHLRPFEQARQGPGPCWIEPGVLRGKAEGESGPAGKQLSQACARALAGACHWAEGSSPR